MTVRDLVPTLDNGSAFLIIIDSKTGEVLYKNNWLNYLSKELLESKINKIRVLDYEMRIFIETGNL